MKMESCRAETEFLRVKAQPMAIHPQQIKQCAGIWLNSWHRERARQETTSTSPDLDELSSQLKTVVRPHLDDEQIKFILESVQTYLRIFLENKHRYPDRAMVGHSALLAYLLLGNQPFADPPTLRYGYPCYALAEGRQVYVEMKRSAYAEVSVDQSICWAWQDKDLPLRANGLLQGILKHIPNGDLYKFDEATAEEGIDAHLRNLSPRQLADLRASGLLRGDIIPVSGDMPCGLPCDTSPTISPETLRRQFIEERANFIIKFKQRGILQGFLQRMDGEAPRRAALEA